MSLRPDPTSEFQRLRERERMYREFLSTVSHDLRTPLTAIKSFAETLLNGDIDDPRQRRRFLETIQRHADRLSDLVDNLLAVAQVESGKLKRCPEVVDLGVFIHEFVDGLAPIAGRHKVSIRVEAPAGLSVWADPTHMMQVLQNLLDNAIKYNRRGGWVDVRARADGPHALVSVKDTGRGIAKADLPVIFLQFQRAKNARASRVPGSGLGLYIIKKIVAANGGRIWAESRWREGSTFHFTLPMATPELIRSGGAAHAIVR